MSNFKLSICQMKVGRDKEKNIEKALEMVHKASLYGAKVVVLPEMFNCPYENSKFADYAEDIYGGKTSRAVSAAAKKHGIYIAAGSIPENREGKIHNTCIFFNPGGKIQAVYRKLHLFDIDIKGKISFRESDTLTAGSSITVTDTELCSTGIAICYDIRFAELFRLMALKGARLVILPGAFNMTTGPAHWELLLRSRAVDNQIYIAAAAPARNTEASYISFGNSMVVDPWGDTAVRAGREENIITADIDLNYLNKIRDQLPLLKHMRKDLYDFR